MQYIIILGMVIGLVIWVVSLKAKALRSEAMKKELDFIKNAMKELEDGEEDITNFNIGIIDDWLLHDKDEDPKTDL